MNNLPRLFLVPFLFLLSLLIAPLYNSALGEEIGAEYPELSPRISLDRDSGSYHSGPDSATDN